MTLHDTAEISKKTSIIIAIGLGAILLITIFVKLGKVISAVLNPPRIAPPNEAYGKMTPIVFPQSTVHDDFTYSINTTDGSLPTDFPDRVVVYPMVVPQPNLLNLDNAKKVVNGLGFIDSLGNTLPEIPRGGPYYEWNGQDDLNRKIIFNIVDDSFTMSSTYLISLTVLNAQYLGDENNAVATVQTFLGNLGTFPTDIDLTLTQNPDPANDYSTTPQLFSINSNELNPTTSLSNAQIIRVDLYQQEVDYTFTAGENQNLAQFQSFAMKMPILYPHPPYSIMNFLVASGDNNQAEVVSGSYNHQVANLQPSNQATYPIKTAQQAFDDLKNGKGYIAAYKGTDSQILISKVYLAYYIGTTEQNYLEPVIVFEGQNGFFAYVPAIADEALQ